MFGGCIVSCGVGVGFSWVIGLLGFYGVGFDRVVGGCVLFVIRWVFDAEWGSCDL